MKLQERTLTGRVRARPGWFGKQILQVEVCVVSFSGFPPPPGRDAAAWKAQMRSAGEQSFSWRDATWSDLQIIGHAELVPRGSIEPSKPWPRAGSNVNPPPDYPRPPAPPSPPPAPTEAQAVTHQSRADQARQPRGEL